MAELAIGVAGLAGLFSTCLEGYKIFLSINNANKDVKLLRTQVYFERERFLNIGRTCGLVEHQGIKGKTQLLQQFLDEDEFRKRALCDTLELIAMLLGEAEDLDRKYASLGRIPVMFSDKVKAPARKLSAGLELTRHYSRRSKAGSRGFAIHGSRRTRSHDPREYTSGNLQEFLKNVLPTTICATTKTERFAIIEEASAQRNGIHSGFSGGPWITGGSNVIGVIGGEGQNLSSSDPRKFAVRFSTKSSVVYDTAVANTVAVNLGYQLGDGPLWEHADLITTGWFTGSKQMDMIVKWSDGEVTLYQGGSTDNPRKPFVGETQMAKPGSIWTHAMGLATVDNVAIVVTWNDGEVSYYGSVDKDGFQGEVRLQAPNSLWADHASYIAGVGPHLCVVWSDGETSLYHGVSANGLHIEQQLIAPNRLWTNVRSLSGGSWVGSSGFDLLVRWIDGEFTIYSDMVEKGFTNEHQVEAPNSLWENAIVTAGCGNAIIVRWIDGEVSLYPNVDGKLHREIRLVAP